MSLDVCISNVKNPSTHLHKVHQLIADKGKEQKKYRVGYSLKS